MRKMLITICLVVAMLLGGSGCAHVVLVYAGCTATALILRDRSTNEDEQFFIDYFSPKSSNQNDSIGAGMCK